MEPTRVGSDSRKIKYITYKSNRYIFRIINAIAAFSMQYVPHHFYISIKIHFGISAMRGTDVTMSDGSKSPHLRSNRFKFGVYVEVVPFLLNSSVR